MKYTPPPPTDKYTKHSVVIIAKSFYRPKMNIYIYDNIVGPAQVLHFRQLGVYNTGQHITHMASVTTGD